MHILRVFLIFAGSLLIAAGAADADVQVAVSIKPIHSLVAAVMKGIGEPALIVQGAGSPHTYSLKPSQAIKIENAQVIFWVGPELETFLEKPLKTIGANAKIVALVDSPGLVTLMPREGGTFDQGTEEGEVEHPHTGVDPHLWLDPENAKAIVGAIAETLSVANPENAAHYRANADAELSRLQTLEDDIGAILAPVKGQHFIVFHDAYQYFEHRFGLEASGSVTVSPDMMPGAIRLKDIKSKIAELGAVCVFAEPEFEPKLVSTVIEGSAAKSGVLDPLGANLEEGPDLYAELMRNMANSLRDCLGGERL
jgi:zinc transport system substrate-binding protein